MLVRASSFTVEVGENGYLIGFTDDYDYPAEMPFGWRCGPATDANAVVLTTTDTGPLQVTIQLHDAPPPPESDGGWEPAEELSLHADLPTLHIATLESGGILDAWPDEEPPLEFPPAPDGGAWVCMRLYCHADDPEPGIGDHGERHLIQLWPALQSDPLHPEITEDDRQQRADYAASMAVLVEEYTTTYPIESGDTLLQAGGCGLERTPANPSGRPRRLCRAAFVVWRPVTAPHWILSWSPNCRRSVLRWWSKERRPASAGRTVQLTASGGNRTEHPRVGGEDDGNDSA